jgi:hypothetical protein
MSYNFNKKQKQQLPNIIDTLLKLDNTQIELLSDNILVNLTNEQLRLIETAPNVNYELILKLRYIDQKDFIKKFSNTNRHDY